METNSHLRLFEKAIRQVYPDLKSDTPLILDNEVDEYYFMDRKIRYFRTTEDFQSVDFKIKRFRNRFYITGKIEKVSPEHVVTRFEVKNGLKIGFKRQGVSDILDKVSELSTNITELSREIYKARHDIAELKKFSAQGFGLSVPSTLSTDYTCYNYPSVGQNDEPNYVEMTPRTQP